MLIELTCRRGASDSIAYITFVSRRLIPRTDPTVAIRRAYHPPGIIQTRPRRDELFVTPSFLPSRLFHFFFSPTFLFVFHLSFLRNGNGVDQYDDGLFPLKRIFTALFSPYSRAG